MPRLGINRLRRRCQHRRRGVGVVVDMTTRAQPVCVAIAWAATARAKIFEADWSGFR
jgi:hypothetical protein